MLIRLPSVEAAIGLRRSAIYGRVARGLFPSPVELGPRSVAWVKSEVEIILAAIINGATEDELRAEVEAIHRARGYQPDVAKRAKYKAIVAKRRAAQKAAA
jgi:prophage regulatory protein